MSIDKEIWKDVPELGGHYRISSHGRVKSVARTNWRDAEK
jgi:hypothetical protein